MQIRWDWLHPVMTAPYVPTLGPAHPQAITPQLFAEAVEITGTGRFLPYDKDRRWASIKDEHVLAGAIVQQPGLVLVPTFSSRSRAVKVHIYSNRPHAALNRTAGLAEQLCASHGAQTGRLVWFLPPGSTPDAGVACTRIQMRTFSPGHHGPAAEPAPRLVVPLDEVPESVRATFSVFAEKLAAEGFAFLDACIRQGGVGPVLTCLRDGKVVGAIGPIEIMPDSRGVSAAAAAVFRHPASVPRARVRPCPVAGRDALGRAAPSRVPAPANRGQRPVRPPVSVRKPHRPRPGVHEPGLNGSC